MIAFVDGVGADEALDAGVTGSRQGGPRPKRPSQASFSDPASQSSLAPAVHDPFQFLPNSCQTYGSSLPSSKSWALAWGLEQHNCASTKTRERQREAQARNRGAPRVTGSRRAASLVLLLTVASLFLRERLCALHEITKSNVFSFKPSSSSHRDEELDVGIGF